MVSTTTKGNIMEAKEITIDMTPTWECSLNILTQSVAGQLEDDEASRKSSAAEIIRAGKLLDTLIEQRKELLAALEMCAPFEEKEFFKTVENYAGTPVENTPEYKKITARHDFVLETIAKVKGE
jgi:hypothetical protein